jgi:hypothetical protein
MRLIALAVLASLLAPTSANAQVEAAVPSGCTDAVNATAARYIADGRRVEADNVMVCGTTIAASRTQYGSRGDHQVLALRVVLPGLGVRTIEIVTNDDLDGVVTAPARAVVFAYGQLYVDVPARPPFVAGIHDTHCATHRGAANGWVVVNGNRFPQHACPFRYR